MEPQLEMVNVLIDTIQTNLSLFSMISINSLPADGGIYVEIRPSYSKSVYLNKKSSQIIPVIFKCKNADQNIALNAIYSIGNYLQALKTYPSGSTFKWLKAEVVESEPDLVGKQEDGSFIYTCKINITINL